MEEEKMNNMKRDYDKEPIIISNNFTSLVFGITFWLMFNGLIIYLIFFGDAINWSQNKEWFLILKDEMSKSTRFGTVLVVWLASNIMAFNALVKNLKNPRTIIFKNEYIKSDKSFNDLEKLELKEILSVKKSFFPLLGTGKVKKNYLGIIIAGIFSLLVYILGWLIRFIAWVLNFVFLKAQPFYSKTPYITIFSKKTNKVLNIHILSKKDYMQIKKYFNDTLNINLDEIQTNFKLINTQGENHGRQ